MGAVLVTEGAIGTKGAQMIDETLQLLMEIEEQNERLESDLAAPSSTPHAGYFGLSTPMPVKSTRMPALFGSSGSLT